MRDESARRHRHIVRHLHLFTAVCGADHSLFAALLEFYAAAADRPAVQLVLREQAKQVCVRVLCAVCSVVCVVCSV